MLELLVLLVLVLVLLEEAEAAGSTYAVPNDNLAPPSFIRVISVTMQFQSRIVMEELHAIVRSLPIIYMCRRKP